MMSHPLASEHFAAIDSSRCRRERLRRIFFAALGAVCVAAVLAGDWWIK